ncbi:pilus assembly protein PilP [Caldichromatium japonicum]|uniref:Pilus assembly protein PilP n=1 Tax=Caldichromatium japonicum TaxID=2699430 RepID=A0A6G7VGA7_9GAMM|nr:pilus assembly protein PilP [Caldichromatium japonicum]
MSWVLALLLLTLLLLTGCGYRDTSDLDSYIAQVNARPPGPIDPIPEPQPVETFVYEPGERRDPFRSDVKEQPLEEDLIVESGPAPDPNRPREELESYPLDSLQMVGTLEQEGIRWGLIRTRDGVIHRVTVGNYLGQNHGQIVEIELDAIHLNEIVADTPGHWRERSATIALTK